MFSTQPVKVESKETEQDPVIKTESLFDYFVSLSQDVKPLMVPMSLKKRKKTDIAENSSLHEFFKLENSKKPKIIEQIVEVQGAQPKASISIPYRTDGDGKGAYYDHYTTQLMTNHPTQIMSDEETPMHKLSEYLHQVTHNFPVSNPTQKGERSLPPVVSIDQASGLLLIPGIARNVYESKTQYQPRKEFDMQLIANAKNRGQPILGVCGGSWLVWEAFGGSVRKVKDHACRQGMPRLKETTGKVGHNIQVHRVKLKSSTSLLAASLKITDKNKIQPLVNSVHWQAPDESNIPAELKISATSLQDDRYAPMSNTGVMMKPEINTIEAFESKHGAPLLGIQWHPEAYTKNSSATDPKGRQKHLLEYMVVAGQAYNNKCHLLDEFKQKASLHQKPAIAFRLKPKGLLGTNFSVLRCRDAKKEEVSFRFFCLKPHLPMRHKREIDAEIREKERAFEDSRSHKLLTAQNSP